MRPHLRLVAMSVALCTTITACGNSESAGTNTVAAADPAPSTAANPTDGEFCEAMGRLIALLAPTDDSSPAEAEATSSEAAGWFEQANNAAPAAIAADFAAYKTAYDEYAHYLRSVDFNLDTVFSTAEGTQLAIDTSHTLTSAIVQYAIDDCGLSFGDEQKPPQNTT